MVRLKRSVYSNLKPSFAYGFAGDILNIISVHGNITIVENVATLYRFHVPNEDLEEYIPPVKPEEKKEQVPEENNDKKPIIKPVKATTKRKLPPQNPTLF